MDSIGKALDSWNLIYTGKRDGTHAACLINVRGECVAKAIDVGRHNAFDKVVGYAYLNGIDVREHFIIINGTPVGRNGIKSRTGRDPACCHKNRAS